MTDLKEQNKKNLYDVTNFREADKVPAGLEYLYWPFAYANVTYKEVIDSPELGAEKYVEFLDKVVVDYVWAPGGPAVAVKAINALGSQAFRFAADDTCIEHAQAESLFMPYEHYDLLKNDLDNYKNEIAYKFKVPSFQKSKEEAYADLLVAIKEIKKYVAMLRLIEKYSDEKGIYQLVNVPIMFYSPLDLLFDRYRGMKDTMIDLRRHTGLVKEVCDIIFESDLNNTPISPEQCDGHNEFIVASTFYHSACMINEKQFDTFFMDYFKRFAAPYMDNGVKFYLKGEGRFLNTADRYRDLPKGGMIITPDEDDVFELANAIGDWATIAGGVYVDKLKYASVEDNVSNIKSYIDKLAPGGGFAFMSNKPLLCANDVNVDNLIAAYNCMDVYGRK